MANILLNTRKNGFTIIEMLIVCMVLVILVGLISTIIFEMTMMNTAFQSNTKDANAKLTFVSTVSTLARGCIYAENTPEALIFHYDGSQFLLEYDLYDVSPTVVINNIDRFIQIDFGGRTFCVNFVPA